LNTPHKPQLQAHSSPFERLLSFTRGIIPGIKRKIQQKAINREWKYIVIHHSATKDSRTGRATEAIRRYHIEQKGWRDIGYHYLIEYLPDGLPTLRTGRGLSEIGAHVYIKDIDQPWYFNQNAIGICIVGDFDRARPPEDKLKFTAQLVRQLMWLCEIPKEDVIGHGEAHERKGSRLIRTCPGNLFNMDKFRALL